MVELSSSFKMQGKPQGFGKRREVLPDQRLLPVSLVPPYRERQHFKRISDHAKLAQKFSTIASRCMMLQTFNIRTLV